MILDKELEFSASQAVTATAASTNIVDRGGPGSAGLSGDGRKAICFTVTEAATAAGAATVTIDLQCDDNSGFSSAKTVWSSGALAKTALIVGYQIFIPLPIDLDERYLRLNYTVATGPLTAGKFSAAVCDNVQKNVTLPDAL